MSAFALRVPDYVLDQARQAAKEDNISLNQLLSAFIAHGLGQRQGLKMMRERAARANVEKVLTMLDNAPDVPPDEGDEFVDEAAGGLKL